MSQLLKMLLLSSTGRKASAAISGLFLTFFLVIHLSGNLLLIKGDGGASFNRYADFMSSSSLISFASLMTYGAILFHGGLTLWLALRNREARGARSSRGEAPVSPLSRIMPLLGLGVLAFLILHLSHIWGPFRFGTLPRVAAGEAAGLRDLQSHVEGVFSSPWMVGIYALGLGGVGAHIAHGVGSAAASLGLSDPRLRRAAVLGGRALGVLLVVGFMLIPVVLYLR